MTTTTYEAPSLTSGRPSSLIGAMAHFPAHMTDHLTAEERRLAHKLATNLFMSARENLSLIECLEQVLDGPAFMD
jgi:hypothetical protein